MEIAPSLFPSGNTGRGIVTDIDRPDAVAKSTGRNERMKMKYTKRAWFVNKFDVVMSALIGPVGFIAFFLLCAKGDFGEVVKPYIGYILWPLVGLLVLNFIMMLVVTHKAWGWLMLPVFFVVRVLATIGAALSGFFIMAGMAFRAAAKESFAKAWVQDERSRNYCEGKKNARTSEGFSSAGTGLWGFFVSHTLPYCEVECE